MDNKGAILKTAKLTIEEKIALLSKTEEAYIRGFIEGAILCGYQKQKRNKPKPKSPKGRGKQLEMSNEK
jgi:hypothetical protein